MKEDEFCATFVYNQNEIYEFFFSYSEKGKSNHALFGKYMYFRIEQKFSLKNQSRVHSILFTPQLPDLNVFDTFEKEIF